VASKRSFLAQPAFVGYRFWTVRVFPEFKGEYAEFLLLQPGGRSIIPLGNFGKFCGYRPCWCFHGVLPLRDRSKAKKLARNLEWDLIIHYQCKANSRSDPPDSMIALQRTEAAGNQESAT
jgi:hypothetical protein